MGFEASEPRHRFQCLFELLACRIPKLLGSLNKSLKFGIVVLIGIDKYDVTDADIVMY
jgi:hypothetical protein